MNPGTAKRLDAARTALKRVDPAMADSTHTDLKTAVELLVDEFEARGGAEFTARVLEGGVVVIPAPVRAALGIEKGKLVTLDPVAVADAPAA